MTPLEALIGLNMIPDIGSIWLNKLLNYFGKPESILKASREKLMGVSGIGEKIALKITALKKEDLDNEFALVKKYGLKIITIGAQDYPDILNNIPAPPIVLYMKGEIKQDDKSSIAIVGSRRASFYGLDCAEKFASQLANLGLTVVSGMARGIDTQAHRGALKAKGRTIAVLGSGFSHIYPSQNRELVEVISNNGAVISEFPCNVSPLPPNFPRRNRIISGLSLGVLVVEAARNSGALITADFALEQGREVFCLPGKIDSQNSFGTNELIKQGAKLVSCVEDILEELNINIKVNIQPHTKGCNEVSSNIKLQGEEGVLYNLLSCSPLSIDDIIEKSKLNLCSVLNGLLGLEIKGFIRQMPGKQFVKKGN